MKRVLAAFALLFGASPVWASDWDFRVGTFEGAFCGAPATFELDEKLPDARVFEGTIHIRDTNETDAIRIEQFDGNWLLITRELGFGKEQTVDTDPPVIEEGMVVFYSQAGRGPGCNNPGANTALRMPLQSQIDAANAQIEDDMDPTGKTADQCVAANSRCENRMLAFGANAPNMIATECTPRFQACMGLAQAAIAALEEEMRVVGKTHDECMASNQRCEARARATFDVNGATGFIASECAPRLSICMNEATRALGGIGGNTQRVKQTVRLYQNGRDTNRDVPAGTEVAIVACDGDTCTIDSPDYKGEIYDGDDYDTLDR